YGGTENNYSNLFDLVSAANDTSANSVPNLLNLADMDEWMHVFAYHRLLGNWDSWTYNVGQNMYAYKVPGKKWKLMPWDIDFVLGVSGADGPTTGLSGGQDPVMNRIFGVPAYQRILWRAYQEALTNVMVAANYTPVIEARRALLVKNNISRLSPTAPIYTYLSQRAAYIKSQIQANDVSQLSITSNGGGNYTSTTATTKITGKAPFAVATIAVNGIPYPVSWTDQNSFSITVPLTTRVSTLTITGLDRSGTLVPGATRTFSVTYNGVVSQAQDYVVINEIQYHPAVPDASFIELYNNSVSTPFDLSGFRLDGAGYTFPAGSIIAPAGYLVLAQNRGGFGLAYGSKAIVFDEFPGSLDNNGEHLSLVKPNGGAGGTNDLVLSDVRYEDNLPWPVNADGLGPSLQLVDPTQDEYRPGNWAATTPGFLNQATPGAANSTVRQFLDPFPLLWINEVLPDNVNGPTDNQGQKDPFVEFYNSGDTSLDLSGYYLTDNYTNLAKWRFPPGTSLGAKQFLVVWVDGQPEQSTAAAPHTSFRLNPTNGTVALVRFQAPDNSPAVMDYIRYQQLPAGRSVGSYPDGEPRNRRWFFFPTAGATNNPAYPDTVVTINEFMAANTTTITNPAGGAFDDWFELYNAGADAVDLRDYTLTSNLATPAMFTIPSGYVIPPGGYLLVWADKTPKASTNGDLHVNFKLSKDGEQIGLFAPNGKLLDSVTFGPQTNDVSQGRFPDGTGDPTTFFETPTPRAANVVIGGNHPPSLVTPASVTVNEMETVTFTATATDPDPGQTVRFSLDPGAPAGATLDAITGAFRWTTTESDGPGVYPITVRVTDNGSPPRSLAQRVTVVVNELNQPPTLAPLGNVVVDDGAIITFTASATDPDMPAQSLTFTLLPGAPAGAAIDARTGVFTWPTPADTAGTTNTISVRVSDGGPGNLNDTKSFTVTTVPKFPVAISEIMYHPAVTNAAYIELLNTSALTSQSLAGFRLVCSNMSHAFPAGSILAPGQYMILAQNRAAFASTYGTAIPVAGEWTGALARSGGVLQLIDPSGKIMHSVSFRATLPWPAEAANSSALQVIDPKQDNSRAGNWRASAAQQWQHVTATGTASSSTLYCYLETVGDAYLDDVRVVAGNNPDSGENAIADGDFESGFPGPYIIGDNHKNSSLSTTVKHSGNASLHMVTTVGGTTRASAIAQDINPALASGQPYTLSYWYLPNTNGGRLTLRLSGSGIVSTVDLKANSTVAAGFTPGAANDVAATLPEFPPLWINEVLPRNVNGLADRTGARQPWIEIINTGNQIVPLDGWTLANDYANPGQWAFPNGTAIQPEGFLVVFADGQTSNSTATELHTSFRLDPTRGGVVLSRPQLGGLGVVDYLDYVVADADQSWGRDPGQFPDAVHLFPAPTPGAANPAASVITPELHTQLTSGGDLTLVWNARPGARYRVETRASLSTPWQTLVEFTATNATAAVTDSTLQRPERYYRVVVP
ncbi:MAG TPA: lamin tail domain-containing protein, partial [Verrucomicrobiae bacterium]|nr:lamin tail domain-containing protein [Verrucomicrobiae bacterium]